MKRNVKRFKKEGDGWVFFQNYIVSSKYFQNSIISLISLHNRIIQINDRFVSMYLSEFSESQDIIKKKLDWKQKKKKKSCNFFVLLLELNWPLYLICLCHQPRCDWLGKNSVEAKSDGCSQKRENESTFIQL